MRMWTMVAGLVLFLGIHSMRMLADDWRSRAVERIGAGPWKALYALVAIIGFVLLVIGYGDWRAASSELWTPPRWAWHVAPLLTLVAFVLLVAAYVPRNRLRARIGHPMLLGTKFWAIAHLLSNGRVADVVLFGAFLAWATAHFVFSRRRDRRLGMARAAAAPSIVADIGVVVLGVLLWALFAFVLHVRWIGVDPMAVLRAGG